LLTVAQRIIPPQTVSYYAFTGDTKNAPGVLVPGYAGAVTIKANVQAVARNMYEELGLDLQKNYVTVYTQQPLRDISRGSGVDRIAYGGRLYEVESNTDWVSQDGWIGSICVDVGAAP
jgi:hypothetical protein